MDDAYANRCKRAVLLGGKTAALLGGKTAALLGRKEETTVDC